MSGDQDSGVLRAITDVRGTPEELAILLDIVKGRGPQWRELGAQGSLTDGDRDAIAQLRERLASLLAQAQREMEQILLRAEPRQRPAPKTAQGPAPAPAVAEPRGSAAGAYLATSGLRRPEPAPGALAVSEPGPDRYAAAAKVAVDGREAALGALAERIVEIQRGLSAL